MLQKPRRFFKNYRNLGLVIISILVSLALDLAGKDSVAHWILGITALASTIPLLWGMVQTLRDGQYGVDVLAATAIITSVILGEYWAGIIIVLMLTGGEALEDYAEERAKTELTALLKRKPRKTHILRGTQTKDIAVSEVRVGDKIVILPGEVVPVDGEVIDGQSSFDESGLTGESIPVFKQTGDNLLSGTINLEGTITIKALHSAADSQYEQIIKLVRSAAASQSPFVRLADRYAIPFTVVSFIVAGAAWFVSGDPHRFLEVLVVATPCPLILGAPIALISGMSRAAKHGIIVKTGSALERLAEVQTIAFDKTGTLTLGKPVVSTVTTFGRFTKNDVLLYAATLEQGSNHVLSQAIIDAAIKRKLKLQSAKQVKEHSGLGLSGRYNGKSVLVGRLSFLESEEISLPPAFKEKTIRDTASYVAINGEFAGVITFNDEIRPESKAMLDSLKKNGINHVLMVTGDNNQTAQAVAKKLGITDVRANCLPADKLRALESIQNRPVAFVGDGVNDAPVLTSADVGIALGARGSTAASESADVVILQDDVAKVAEAVQISQRTLFIAKQSILIGIFISLGLMGIFSTGKFKAVQGALLQELVDIIVILNALRAHGSFRNKS